MRVVDKAFMWRLLAFTVTYVVSDTVLSWDAISSSAAPVVIAVTASVIKIQLFILHERHWVDGAEAHFNYDFSLVLFLVTAPCIVACVVLDRPWWAAGWLALSILVYSLQAPRAPPAEPAASTKARCECVSTMRI